MRQKTLRWAVAFIIIFGHLAVFFVGFFGLGILSVSFSQETAQIVLMSSPLTATAAVAAVRYALDEELRSDPGPAISYGFALICLAIPILLLLAIFLLFWITYQRVNGFSFDSLKISLGVVETIFGVFLGMIVDRLFGKGNRASPPAPAG